MTYTEKQVFIGRMKRETGRVVELASLRCEMCGGHGFSAFEPLCTECSGDGTIDAWIYSDCGCPLESEGDLDCLICFPETETDLTEVAA